MIQNDDIKGELFKENEILVIYESMNVPQTDSDENISQYLLNLDLAFKQWEERELAGIGKKLEFRN
jgi:hypothetical protein